MTRKLGANERAILEILKRSPGEWDASTLSAKLAKSHSIVLRALNTLRAKGLVTRRQHPERVYDIKRHYVWSAA